MWVKICANTCLDDTLAAADSGADAVGFVFAPSTRRVTPQTVAPISAYLAAHHPQMERVGVFQSLDPGQIAAMTLAAGLTAVQIHGGYDADLPSLLRASLGPEVCLIQVLHRDALEADQPGDHNGAAASGGTEVLDAQLRQVAAAKVTDRVLIDSKSGTATGGTGLPFDWSTARPLFAAAPRSLRLIVAGGLSPRNVAEAISELSPWGVDVASGVESAPGRKDARLVRTFIHNARRALS